MNNQPPSTDPLVADPRGATMPPLMSQQTLPPMSYGPTPAQTPTAPGVTGTLTAGLSKVTRAGSWLMSHEWVLGLVIIASLCIAWWLWRWWKAPSSASIVLSRFGAWPGWVIEGSEPSYEIAPLRVTPFSMLYNTYEGGIHTYVARAKLTHHPDGITTCTGLYIRPSGEDLEISLTPSGKFQKMKRAEHPIILASVA